MYSRKKFLIFALSLICGLSMTRASSAMIGGHPDIRHGKGQSFLLAANDTDSQDPEATEFNADAGKSMDSKTKELMDLYSELEKARNDLETLEKKRSEARNSREPKERKWYRSKSKNEVKDAKKAVKDLEYEINRFERNYPDAKNEYKKIKENQDKETVNKESDEMDEKIKKRLIIKEKKIEAEIKRRMLEEKKKEAAEKAKSGGE